MRMTDIVFGTKPRAILFGGGLGLILHYFLISDASASEFSVQDHFKNIIVKKPYVVEECEERLVGGDKTADTLGGAIVGAAIGNAIGKDTEATVAGAAIGGLIGHNKSKATPTSRLYCQIVTHYDVEEREVYSHSTVTFQHNGQVYTERFVK